MHAVEHENGWAPGTWLARISSMAGISACLGDLCMTYLLAARYPDYNSLTQAMSDLGHFGSPVAALASGWWVLMGVLFILFGYGFHKVWGHRGKPARTAAWMIALYGLGEGLGSGLVRGSAGESVFATPASFVHTMLGGVGMLGAVLLPFVVTRMYGVRESPRVYWYAWITMFAGLLFLLLFGVGTFYGAEGSWISLKGLWQRLAMLVYYVFFMWLALSMWPRQGSNPAE